VEAAVAVGAEDFLPLAQKTGHVLSGMFADKMVLEEEAVLILIIAVLRRPSLLN
jgi:hypothetical protein